ncbi:alpha/beta hydrolase, putative [Plasmodium reichenowi]|uniref:Alpha/beta hydrolase, putative n=1 Tax=Plasmodium reichenowi TaxID=5854 RepID=A0A060RRF5_PLARE|nr:alpha/beta hydrolase, putative [Plasmodium reichenowi]
MSNSSDHKKEEGFYNHRYPSCKEEEQNMKDLTNLVIHKNNNHSTNIKKNKQNTNDNLKGSSIMYHNNSYLYMHTKKKKEKTKNNKVENNNFYSSIMNDTNGIVCSNNIKTNEEKKKKNISKNTNKNKKYIALVKSIIHSSDDADILKKITESKNNNNHNDVHIVQDNKFNNINIINEHTKKNNKGYDESDHKTKYLSNYKLIKNKFKKKKENIYKFSHKYFDEKYKNHTFRNEGNINVDKPLDEQRYSDAENFIIYKVPKYLKKKNIKCPFVYRKVFFGKYGIINYDIKGNITDTLVITFHGLNGSNLTFLEMQNILIKYKFQVLNFDLYGHGLSACPKYNHKKKTYGIDFFLYQIEELLNHLKLQDKDFYLIGFSMGCVIAICFAKKYIKQVKKIILISPVGVLEKKPFPLKILKLFPCLINLSSFFMLPCFFSKRKFKKKGDAQNDTENFMYNRFMWQAFVKKNISHSILGCINNLKMWSAHEIFKDVGLHEIQVLFLCGENDHFCKPQVFKNTSTYFINCHLIIFKNASHLVLLEKSQEINLCTLTFFHMPNNVELKDFQHLFPVDSIGNYVFIS